MTLQMGWPIGMPLAKKLESELWELRSKLSVGRARVIFSVEPKSLVLLHAFIKKSRKTPKPDLKTARKRLAALKEN
jgi:phage-related protein